MNTKFSALIFSALLGLAGRSFSQSPVIPDIKSPMISCNYLVITPSTFLSPAKTLARFRHDRSGYQTGIILTDSIYSQFDSLGRKPHEKIWKALKYARDSWTLPPEMVVLLGSDSLVFNKADSSWESRGAFPAVVYRHEWLNDSNPLPYYSDDFYACLADSMPVWDDHRYPWSFSLNVGRIPCTTAEECSAYVQKVIDFEQNRHDWKRINNSAIVVTDDTLQGPRTDPLNITHLRMGESCANALLDGWFVDKIVGCTFPADTGYKKPAAADSIVASINRGALFSVYVGHGHEAFWSDEHMISFADASRLHNDSTPSVFLALACDNGAFAAPDSSMCNSFLFKPQGGALAYIASTSLAYAYSNEQLMTFFFEEYRKAQDSPLAKLFTIAKRVTENSSVRQFVYLGDPAIVVSDAPMNIAVELSTDTAKMVIRGDSAGTPVMSGNYEVRQFRRDTVRFSERAFYQRDSLLITYSGLFTNGAVELPLASRDAQVAIYLWTPTAEGRMDTAFSWQSDVVTFRNGRNAMPFSIAVVNGLIVLKRDGISGANTLISAFTMSGRRVFSRKVNPATASMVLDPSEMGLSAGVFVFRIKSGQHEFSRTIGLNNR